MSAVWALQGVVPHGKKEKLTPGVEIEENPVFGFWDCFMELIVNLPVSGIKPIVPGHLEVFFRYMQNEQLNEINGGERLFFKKGVFMLFLMENHQLPPLEINPGKSNDRAAKITADIFNNGFWVAKIGLGINVESISVPMVNGGFHLFKRGTDAFFQFI